MILETTIDASLNRLISHFGPRVVFRPPATAAELTGLAATVGPLPRDLTIFLATCNGLRIESEVRFVPRRIWSVQDMLAVVRPDSDSNLPPGLVPVLGEIESECDCVAVSAPARDAVIRWDASAPGAMIVASSFDRYLDAWTRFVVGPPPNPNSRRASAHFGADFLARHDPALPLRREDHRIREWLHSLDLALACGDDFE